jgi:hypothetical protein
MDGPFKTCTASDQCHVAGVCSPKTGECTNPPADNGTECNDGEKCTLADVCREGACGGTELICRNDVICDESSGTCPNQFPTPRLAWVFNNVEWPSNGSGLAQDPYGNIFLGGAFYNQVDLGSGVVMTEMPRDKTNNDIFLAQLDANTGKAKWTQAFNGPQTQYVTSFAVNAGGQLGIVGDLQGAFTVKGEELTALYTGDQYILGASAVDGSGLWARRVSLQKGKDNRKLGFQSIAGDPQSNGFVVCGTTARATSDLYPSLQLKGGMDIVVARLDGLTGETEWAYQYGGINDETCNSLAIDNQSNTYLVGTYTFGSEVEFGDAGVLPIVDVTGGIVWMYLVKLDPSGKPIWKKGIGRGQQSIIPTTILAIDDAMGKDVLVAGNLNDGSLMLENVGLGSTTFMARYDGTTGDLKWIEGLGSGGNVVTTSFSLVTDRVMLAGKYDRECMIGNVPMPSADSKGGTFVAQMDGKSGLLLAARGYGNPGNGNKAAGVIGRPNEIGDGKDGTWLLLSFYSQVDLGQPIGTLQASTTDTSIIASCVVELAP